MFPWSVDKRVDNQQTSHHFPKWRTYQRRTTQEPSTPTTSLEQNPRETVFSDQIDLRGITASLKCWEVIQIPAIHRENVASPVSDLHLRLGRSKAETFLRLAIHDTLIAITTRVHQQRCPFPFKTLLKGADEDASSIFDLSNARSFWIASSSEMFIKCSLQACERSHQSNKLSNVDWGRRLAQNKKGQTNSWEAEINHLEPAMH